MMYEDEPIDTATTTVEVEAAGAPDTVQLAPKSILPGLIFGKSQLYAGLRTTEDDPRPNALAGSDSVVSFQARRRPRVSFAIDNADLRVADGMPPNRRNAAIITTLALIALVFGSVFYHGQGTSDVTAPSAPAIDELVSPPSPPASTRVARTPPVRNSSVLSRDAVSTVHPPPLPKPTHAPPLAKAPPLSSPPFPRHPPPPPSPPLPPTAPARLCLNSTHGSLDDAGIQACDATWCASRAEADMCTWCKCAACTACAAKPKAPSSATLTTKPAPFVNRYDVYLFRGGAFNFMMANVWHAAWLGSDGSGGDRSRLRRELDRLKGMDVTVVRLLASSEGCRAGSTLCAWSMQPAMQPEPGRYDHQLLVGLDFALAELEARGMVAVMVLNNAWPSSGGFAQYIEWAGGPAAPMPGSAEKLWHGIAWERLRFFSHAARFFGLPEAVRLSHQHIRTLLSRRNSITGRIYAKDPTVMSWELANEPRAMDQRSAYRAWVASTSQLIKQLAPHHLVTIGSEGAHADLAEKWLGKGEASGWEPDMASWTEDHAPASIDYTTCHLWLEPWGWLDQDEGENGVDKGVQRAKQYLQAHVQAAAKMGKPLVVAEVGLARDSERYGAVGSVDRRNRLFKAIFDAVQASVDGRDALAGVGFSGWAGEGRRKQKAVNELRVPVAAPVHRIESNVYDSSVYDNSVYDTDSSTVALICAAARRWREA